MIRKSLALLVVGFVLFVSGQAQTPAPGAKSEAHAFSMFFDGDSGYLGIQTEEITRDNFGKYGLREVRGVAVEKVLEGSPAEKAGIQNGDVIIRFENEEITGTRKLTRMLAEVSPDHQVRLTVLRGGSEREITATVGKRPMPKFDEGSFSMNMPRVPFPPQGDFPGITLGDRMPRFEGQTPRVPRSPGEPFAFAFGSGRRIGVGVSTLTKQLSEHFGVTGGLMINEVRVDSPAAKAGLKAGDIIVEADGKEVKNEGDLIRVIGERKEGDVTLTIIRDRNRQTVRVTPEEVKDGFNTFFEFPTPPEGVTAPKEYFKLAVPSTPPVPLTEFRFPGRIL